MGFFLNKHIFFIAVLIILSQGAFAAGPVLSNFSHPNDTWASQSQISGNVAYPSATEFIYLIDKEEKTIPLPDDNKSTVIAAKSTRIVFGTKSDGIYYLHIRARANSLSDTTHSKIMIDTEPPSVPKDFRATTLANGSIKLDWSVSEDEDSGTDHYELYRSRVRFIVESNVRREIRITDRAYVTSVSSNLKDTTYTDSNIEVGKGYYYFYILVAEDKAGSTSKPSPILTVKGISLCDFNTLLTVDRVGTFVNISVVASDEFKKGSVIVEDPNGESSVIVENISNVKMLDTNFSLAGKINGDYNVSFYSNDVAGDVCSDQYDLIYDDANPQIEILTPSSTKALTDVVRFEFSASDTGQNPSGIKEVSLFVKKTTGEVRVGAAREENSKFVFDWNTINFDNGRFTVIAKAFDNAGNSAQDSVVYSIENTFFARVGTEKAIADANAERNKTLELLDSFAKKNIDVRDLNSSLRSADENLAYAVDLFQKNP